MIYLANAFSISMLQGDSRVLFSHWGLEDVHEALTGQEWKSVVGHSTTANLIAEQIGRDVPTNRVSVSLTEEDLMIVAQYKGQRLPEGTTTLPEGASFDWWAIRLLPSIVSVDPPPDMEPLDEENKRHWARLLEQHRYLGRPDEDNL